MVEWELRIEGDGFVLDGDVGDGLDDRQVLLIDIDDGQGGVVAGVWCASFPASVASVAAGWWATVGGVDGDAEFQSLRLGLDVLGVDGQGLEDGEFDLANVGARAWHNEVLVDGREGKLASAGGEEGKGAGDLAEEVAVEAVLLAFLADNRDDATNQAIISVSCED